MWARPGDVQFEDRVRGAIFGAFVGAVQATPDAEAALPTDQRLLHVAPLAAVFQDQLAEALRRVSSVPVAPGATLDIGELEFVILLLIQAYGGRSARSFLHDDHWVALNLGGVEVTIRTALWALATDTGFASTLSRILQLRESAAPHAILGGMVAGAFRGAGDIPEAWLLAVPGFTRLERTACDLLVTHYRRRAGA